MAGQAPPYHMHFRGQPQCGPADCAPMGIWSALVVFGSASSGLSISGMGTPEDSLKKCTPNLNWNVNVDKPSVQLGIHLFAFR